MTRHNHNPWRKMMILLPPQAEEWNSINDSRPPRGVLVQFKQQFKSGLYTRWIGTLEELGNVFNVAGLSWKLTGIGREQIEERQRRGERVVIAFPGAIRDLAQINDHRPFVRLSELMGGPQ